MKKLFGAISLIFVFIFTGCSSNYSELIRDKEAKFYNGQYLDAARDLLPMVNKENADQLLFMMECGLMLHAGNDYDKSTQVFFKASELSEKIATRVSQQAASLFLNESVTNYKGEDFERVLIHMYLGINFLMQQNYDESRVEFKKVNNLLEAINVKGGKSYKQNIMAKYLTALSFEQIGVLANEENDIDFAYVELKQINKLDPQNMLVKYDLARIAKQYYPEDYGQWEKFLGEKPGFAEKDGELVVIFENGKGAIKASRGKLLDDVNMSTSIRLSLDSMTLNEGITVAGVMTALAVAENPIPKFQKRNNGVDHLIVNINGKKTVRSYLMEDIENTAIRNMEDDYSRLYAKVAAGIVVKTVTSLAAAKAAEELAKQSSNTSSYAGLIGAVTGSIVGVGFASQIKPDLRCWHTLPSNLQLAKCSLPKGSYSIEIKYVDSNGAILATENRNIDIAEKKKSFINLRTFY